MINKIIKKIKGIKKTQKFFKYLFYNSLEGMNYGSGASIKESGEIETIKYIKKKLEINKKSILFDVGCNIGDYSRALLKIFGDKAEIHSFEPSKKAFQLFLINTKGVKNIFANNIGLSNIEDKKLLYSDTEGSVLSSIYKRDLKHFGINFNASEIIELSTIDKYCEKNKISKINFLKIDVEGHELSVLEGAKNMIGDKKIDFIQFEFGGCNIDSRTYLRDFFNTLSDNYIIYRVLKDGLFEIQKYEESLEIFITTNYLAERK